MLDRPPRDPEWLSWTYVVGGSLIIFCTVPLARAIQSGIVERFGHVFFLYFSFAALAIAGTTAARTIYRRQLPWDAYLWLAGTGVAFFAYANSLRDNAIETIHLIEYGILGVLTYRALVHRVRDYSIYVVTVLIVGIVGLIDEWIQWITPSRYWDLRDVQINLWAAVLSQLSIGAGLRPRLVSSWPSHTSLIRLLSVSAVAFLVLGLSFANTPERIAAYATRIPFLSFLMSSRNMMIEYGYLYSDPEIGIFRSRFTSEALQEYDRQRGMEVADVFDTYINDQRYGEFQDLYSVLRDAYVHEAGVHLFRRNRNLEFARQHEVGCRKHYNIAFREDQILEKYFPTGIRNSGHRWTKELRAQVERNADTTSVYESGVSEGVITRVSERQALIGFGSGVLICLSLAACLGRRRHRRG